ncbi:uncharacterized protein LOC126747558 [Anthonomus grandis grandis]|uniref:uncharacterized protein LOC126747558 n=1 Tax=Anthonomus grandis grandis TaxID=2921223 RepID=UPI00216586D1|nr:uncharacterized protein LOC126747558 [Anthonomus grandis grandis]
MIHTSRKLFLTVLLISAWTLVQTVFHLFWVLYGYLALMCKVRPEYYDVVFVYLTYFYKSSCGPIHLKKETLFLNTTTPEDALHNTNETTSNLLYRFLVETLNKGELPLQSETFNRTEMYLSLFCISDIGWFLSAIGLSVGAFCKLKQKYFSIVFYGPWLLCSLFVNFLDVVSSVHFGIDLISINSYTTWLQFVGVANYDDFVTYDSHPSSKVIPAIPSTLLASLLSRFFFVWLLNVVCFFVILLWAIPDLFLKTTVRRRQGGTKQGGSFRSEDELDFNTSAARIRNWQLFYGAVEANSTMASSSGEFETTDCADHNSNSRNKHHVTFTEKSPLENKPSTSLGQESGNFRRFSDVAGDVATLPHIVENDVNDDNMAVLRGQRPWSYLEQGKIEFPKKCGVIVSCTRL